MTFNVHSLLHLVHSARETGPLWATSAFPFESEMGHLKEFVTGTTDVSEQVINHVLELNEFNSNVLTNPCEDGSFKFCKRMMSSKHSVMTHHRSEEGAIVLYSQQELSKNQYKRCIFQNIVLHSALYTRAQLTDDTIICLSNGEVVEILYFYSDNNECHIQARNIELSRVNISANDIEHIFVVMSRDTEERSIPITQFEKKMVHLDVTNDLEYVCSPFDVFDAQ
ncbi:hypothetical protein QAD02_003306 [Eretmocerus hayati]|uniref:Uncharacterized protein n=1 Tax=Eretmocerus hayati TaxID=131215 RepID=A0ACC2NLQ7_9HYME|nr:hypothetical protein QAD02_003306 [Eretmocerus hayati]